VPEETFGDKTEQPTPRRRQEARQRGQVAKSQDLSGAIVLAAGLAALAVLGTGMFWQVIAFARFSFMGAPPYELTTGAATAHLQWLMAYVAKLLAPFMIAIGSAALAGTLLQTGFVLSGHSLRWEWSRINPVYGMKRIFSRRGFMRLVTSVFKVAMVGSVAYFTIRGQILGLMGTIDADFWQIIAFAGKAVLVLGIRVTVVLLVLAILDYGFQKWQHERDLMMTRQEIREEMRRLEGDPLTRQRRQRMQRQIAMQRMMQQVPRADVVITNPTEIAVAIQYESGKMNAPTLVAKGRGLVAGRIREIAQDNGVPIVEQKPLAQAIYKRMEVGDEIPPDLYKAVAEVLAYVYQLDGSRRKGAVGAGV